MAAIIELLEKSSVESFDGQFRNAENFDNSINLNHPKLSPEKESKKKKRWSVGKRGDNAGMNDDGAVDLAFDMDLDVIFYLLFKARIPKSDAKIYIKACFTTYKDLRENFWKSLCKSYDSDNNGKLNKEELQTMLVGCVVLIKG